MDVDVRGIVVGFGLGVVVLATLLWFVGFDEVAATFRMLDARYVVVILLAGLAWLTAWGFALRTVLGALGVDIGRADAVLLYASAAFANNVTPFGQAGGEPFSALLISRSTDTEYERGLAAIASVDSLNFAPSIVLALAGFAYYLTAVTLNDDLVSVVMLVVALAVAVPFGGFLVWRNRDRVESGLAAAIAPAATWVAGHVPRVDAPDEAAVRHRVASFFHAIERVGSRPRGLLLALTFSAAGWLAMCSALWLSLFALGFSVPPAAVLIAVPVGSIAGVTPLPGGLGGVEFAIVLLIVPTTGVSAATASAAALIYRGATYWLSTIVGGGSVAFLETTEGR